MILDCPCQWCLCTLRTRIGATWDTASAVALMAMLGHRSRIEIWRALLPVTNLWSQRRKYCARWTLRHHRCHFIFSKW